jgi:hypothetical protein
MVQRHGNNRWAVLGVCIKTLPEKLPAKKVCQYLGIQDMTNISVAHD